VTFAFQTFAANHFAGGLVNCDISTLAVKALAFAALLAVEKIIRFQGKQGVTLAFITICTDGHGLILSIG
jgi:hypothetical protein